MQTYKKFVFALFLAVLLGIGAVSVRAATAATGPAPLVIAQAGPGGGAAPHHHRKRWFALAGAVIIVVVALAVVARRRKPGDAAVKRIG
jgi:hypothetical protein